MNNHHSEAGHVDRAERPQDFAGCDCVPCQGYAVSKIFEEEKRPEIVARQERQERARAYLEADPRRIENRLAKLSRTYPTAREVIFALALVGGLVAAWLLR